MNALINRMEHKRNELLDDVASVTARLLTEHDVQPAAAELLGAAVADYLADHWGGQNLTVPKDYKRKLCAREVEIYRSFNGDYAGLAKAHGMTERGMRKLIDRVRQRIRKAQHDAQGQLPV
jgi:Mor family transcriptional regulator